MLGGREERARLIATIVEEEIKGGFVKMSTSDRNYLLTREEAIVKVNRSLQESA